MLEWDGTFRGKGRTKDVEMRRNERREKKERKENRWNGMIRKKEREEW